jgi:hypothetical protein
VTGPGRPYIRWKVGEPRESKVMPALKRDHPLYNEPCPSCGVPLGLEEMPVQLLAIGPDSEQALVSHRSGQWYSARALAFHALCLGTAVSQYAFRIEGGDGDGPDR